LTYTRPPQKGATIGHTSIVTSTVVATAVGVVIAEIVVVVVAMSAVEEIEEGNSPLFIVTSKQCLLNIPSPFFNVEISP